MASQSEQREQFVDEASINGVKKANKAHEKGEQRTPVQVVESRSKTRKEYVVSLSDKKEVEEEKKESTSNSEHCSVKGGYEPYDELLRLGRLEQQKNYLLANFEKVSEETRQYILKVVERGIAGTFTPPVEREPCIYDNREPDETVAEFILRLYPNIPRTWSKTKDGDAVEFIRKHFQGEISGYNFINPKIFNRTIMAEIIPPLRRGLSNWLQAIDPRTGEKNKLPDDLNIPPKPGQSKIIIKDLTKEEINAVRSLASR